MMTVFKCAKINLDSSSPSALCARDNGKNLFTGPLVLSAANSSDIIISLFSPICEMKEKKLVCHVRWGFYAAAAAAVKIFYGKMAIAESKRAVILAHSLIKLITLMKELSDSEREPRVCA